MTEIREMRVGDEEGVAALFAATWEHEGYPATATEAKDVAGIIEGTEMTRRWVAVQDGAIVGHVAVVPAESHVYGGAYAVALKCEVSEVSVVVRLAVSPTARREGVGAALLEKAREGGPIGLAARGERVAAAKLYAAAGLKAFGDITWTRGSKIQFTALWVGSAPE